MLGVCRNDCHRIGCRLEQQVVNDGLIVEGDVSDLGREREDDVEVADGQQVGFARFQPCPGRRALALGAMPVAAAIECHAPVATVGAGLDMPAQRGCAAQFNRRHDFQLMQGQVPGMGSSVGGSCFAEDVGDLKRWSHRISRRVPCLPSTR